jgi:DNA invertase Pin-like site-specific DNA recombinase
MKATNISTKLTKANLEAIVKDEKMSKSEKVRKLFDGGLEVKEIATLLNIRYNFAYNVLQNYVIVNDIQVTKAERETKRDDIVKLLQAGKSLVEVCKATKSNYNYVWKISKEMKAEQSSEQKAEVK